MRAWGPPCRADVAAPRVQRKREEEEAARAAAAAAGVAPSRLAGTGPNGRGRGAATAVVTPAPTAQQQQQQASNAYQQQLAYQFMYQQHYMLAQQQQQQQHQQVAGTSGRSTPGGLTDRSTTPGMATDAEVARPPGDAPVFTAAHRQWLLSVLALRPGEVVTPQGLYQVYQAMGPAAIQAVAEALQAPVDALMQHVQAGRLEAAAAGEPGRSAGNSRPSLPRRC